MADREVIITPYARLSFPSIAKPRAYESGDQPKFGCALLFPKPAVVGDKRDDGKPVSPWGDADKHDLSELQAKIDEYVENTWPNAKQRPKNLKLPIQDGDDKSWDGYADHFFLRASSIRPPRVIDARKNEVTGDDIEKVFYPGCWVRAVINLFDYSTKGNKGVSAGLQLVQFVRDDDPFTGGVDPDDLDDLPDEDLAPDDLDDLD